MPPHSRRSGEGETGVSQLVVWALLAVAATTALASVRYRNGGMLTQLARETDGFDRSTPPLQQHQQQWSPNHRSLRDCGVDVDGNGDGGGSGVVSAGGVATPSEGRLLRGWRRDGKVATAQRVRWIRCETAWRSVSSSYAKKDDDKGEPRMPPVATGPETGVEDARLAGKVSFSRAAAAANEALFAQQAVMDMMVAGMASEERKAGDDAIKRQRLDTATPPFPWPPRGVGCERGAHAPRQGSAAASDDGEGSRHETEGERQVSGPSSSLARAAATFAAAANEAVLAQQAVFAKMSNLGDDDEEEAAAGGDEMKFNRRRWNTYEQGASPDDGKWRQARPPRPSWW